MSILILLFVVVSFPLRGGVPSPSELQHALNQAIAKHDNEFRVASGDYHFNTTNFMVMGAKDMKIIAETGVTFWFSIGQNHGETPAGGGVVIQDCENVELEGFSIDYQPAPFVQGIVMAALGHDTVIVKTASGYLQPDQLGQHGSVETQAPALFWDPETREMTCSGWKGPHNIERTPGKPQNWWTIPLKYLTDAPAMVGKLLTINIRRGRTYTIVRGKRIVSRDITIYAAPYMAILEIDGEGPNTYTGMKLLRRNGRLLASNADMFHSVGVQHGPTLTESTLTYSNDDFINVHNTLVLTLQRLTDHTLLLVDPHLVNMQNDTIYATAQTLTNVKPGNKLVFYELNSLFPLASVIVSTIKGINSTDIHQRAIQMRTVMNSSPYSAKPAIMHFFPIVYEVTFQDPLPSSVQPYSTLVSFNQWAASAFTCKNNLLKGTGCRTMRLKSSNSIIYNNTFSSACLLDFQIKPLQGWMEGQLGIHNITVEQNTFIKCGPDPFKISYATDVHLINNTILP